MGAKKFDDDKRVWVTPKDIETEFSYKRANIYDWVYRPENYPNIPIDEILHKKQGRLKINRAAFENWFYKKDAK